MKQLHGKNSLIRLGWGGISVFGLYLLLAWVSYSPLDNSWSVASSMSEQVMNKSGSFGAWLIDLLMAMWGYGAVFVPCSLILSSFYLLLTGRAEQIGIRTALLWCVSFTAWLLGISALATVFFSNSDSYLSGGFVGEIFNQEVSERFGQIGVLLFAMLLTVIGFYFCSGQTVIQLISGLYHWTTAHPERTATQSVAQMTLENVSEIEVNSLPQSDGREEENNMTVELTDVSHFPRPKITRLNTTAFSTTLPNTNIENTSITLETSSEGGDVMLPKVTLNPLVDEQPDMIQGGEKKGENAKVILPEADESPQFVGERQQLVAEAQKSTSTPSVGYPASYGESLIHPLLQKQKVLEKPTTPLPTLDLLTQMPPQGQKISDQEIRETSARIEQELANFGVKATVEAVLEGPVVTRYEIQPAAGVKASKISSLDSDLARALIFKAIRITDVVPGKPFMGIETPNRQRETVWLREVLESEAFRNSKAILPMALGKSISGEPVVVDMAKMPHLLVAGQTGGGKSVGVNTMILSLLFKMTPEQVRFIMIDPKVVELSIYNDIPHLLTPVVTDMKKAENALRWAVEEMERRYLLVSSLSVRNIEGYNDKIRQAAEMGLPIPNPLWRPGDTMDALPPPLEKMTYIVLIVDEFADLMMSAGKQVEDHIMRIAQKARAVGIHLILATQRPSTDVITGVIKANIPSRIAFTVASQIDSRTILDKGGAETLLGRGDMLYSGAGSPEIIRVHGAFMTDDDVQRVADNWRARGKPSYIDSIVESAADEVDSNEKGQGTDLDPLFDEISQYIIESNVTSISGIQRRFSLGFNRAARIIDQLEEQGIVSAPDGRGKREVLAR